MPNKLTDDKVWNIEFGMITEDKINIANVLSEDEKTIKSRIEHALFLKKAVVEVMVMKRIQRRNHD